MLFWGILGYLLLEDGKSKKNDNLKKGDWFVLASEIQFRDHV